MAVTGSASTSAFQEVTGDGKRSPVTFSLDKTGQGISSSLRNPQDLGMPEEDGYSLIRKLRVGERERQAARLKVQRSPDLPRDRHDRPHLRQVTTSWPFSP